MAKPFRIVESYKYTSIDRADNAKGVPGGVVDGCIFGLNTYRKARAVVFLPLVEPCPVKLVVEYNAKRRDVLAFFLVLYGP